MDHLGFIYILILILFLVVLAWLVWLLILQLQINSINITGTQWQITYGSTTANSDIVPGGGAQLFVAQSSSTSYIANIQPSTSSSVGQNLWIKNKTANIISISVASGVSLDTGMLGNTVTSGQTAQLVYTAQDTLLRLN